MSQSPFQGRLVGLVSVFCLQREIMLKHLQSVIVHDSSCQSSAMKTEKNFFFFKLGIMHQLNE